MKTSKLNFEKAVQLSTKQLNTIVGGDGTNIVVQVGPAKDKEPVEIKRLVPIEW